MTPYDISVVIPTLNEQMSIGAAIQSARGAGAGEVIVSDGGSTDATTTRASESGATTVVHSLAGRGIQLNTGATFASGEMILFLHADSTLDADCLHQVCDRPEADWGAFEQQIDHPSWTYRTIEIGNAWRVRWRAMPFGDQAMFVRRSLFKQQGGFAEIPLMEDVELSKRLRRVSRPALLSGPVTTSARRWERRGVIRQTLQNWRLQLAYAMGTRAEQLADRY